MKIVYILGSLRTGQTFRALEMFIDRMKSLENVESEIIQLKDLKLKSCIGCATCIKDGEEHCPLKDDRDIIIDKMKKSDGVIFATPNYSLHVTWIMKNFYDRLAFFFHRPAFFGKIAIGLVTQGVYGGEQIGRYIETVSGFWGFNVCKSIVLTTPWGAFNPKEKWLGEEKIAKALDNAGKQFIKKIKGKPNPSPSLKRYIIFHGVRTSIQYLKDKFRDYEYFKEKGWFESDYYYKTRIGLVKKIAGKIIDNIVRKDIHKMNTEK